MSVLVNKVPTKPFRMQRGLRQRDPLSPFSVIFVVEVLNKLLEKAKECSFIESLVVGQKEWSCRIFNSWITHFFFVQQRRVF